MAGGVLGTGVSGLLTAQRALEVTGNNIANANTEGYTRQIVQQAALQSQYVGSGYIGKGVEVANISRSYDQFLTAQLRSSTSAFGDVDQYKKMAGQIDTFLADPASGLSPVMKDFFNGLNKVANDPSSIAARQTLLSNAETLVSRYNSMNDRLQGIQTQVGQEMVANVEQVNTYAASIADLNKKIAQQIKSSSGGQQPNDLLDQRDLLLSKMSGLVDVSIVPQYDGMTSVYIGKGQPLVLNDTSSNLLINASTTDPTKLDISLQTNSGNPQVITSEIVGGQLGGTIRFRDEMLAPEQQNLRNVAETITKEVNTLHTAGFDLNGAAGTDFFSFDTGLGRMTANITDPRKFAAATAAASVPGDNRNALALANLENKAVAIQQNGVATGVSNTFQDAYDQIVSKVGALTRSANISATAQESLLNNTKSAYESQSGVNLDEEAANLIKYQQAYQAAAQLISVTKGLFDSLLGAFG